jgi:ABC-type nitrate/sulfonate/bicarbonate transport system permease component
MTIYLNKPAEEEVEETVEEESKSSLWYLGFVIGVVVGLPLATMLLWNWLIPAIFGLPTIGFLKSMGILALSYILFKR